MSLINICRDNHDPFYRYKMPPIQAKIEGRGNGIKTNVLNAVEVSRALNRPTSYVIKYFGFELGAQTSMNESQERYLVNGVHEADKLQDVLDGFISKFVLCPSCKNPETILNVTDDGHLKRDCKACGKETEVDPRLKLVTYILKNPPTQETKGSKKAATASANVVGGGTSISEIAAKHAADDSAKAPSAAAAAPPSQEVKMKDDDWAVDMSEAAVEARAQELNAINLGNTNEKYEKFGEWIEAGDELPGDVAIFKKAQELDILNDRKTVEVLAQCIFGEDIVEEIDEHKGLLSKLLSTPQHEKSLLGGIERMIGTEHIDLVAKVPRILMQLYQDDLVSEDVIRQWGTHVTKKYVPKPTSQKIRKAAKPFLNWLDEADEDDDEEEEESEGDDEE